MRPHARTNLPCPVVLDHGLDVGDGVAALDLQRRRLPGQRLHEDLHLAGARGSLAGGMGFWGSGWGGVAELGDCTSAAGQQQQRQRRSFIARLGLTCVEQARPGCVVANGLPAHDHACSKHKHI